MVMLTNNEEEEEKMFFMLHIRYIEEDNIAAGHDER